MKHSFNSTFEELGLSPIVEISERAAELAPKFEKETGKPFIYFQRGEVGFDTPKYVANALSDAVLKKGFTKYPKSGGAQWLKIAIINHLAEMNVRNIAEDNIVATYGGQEGLELSFLQLAGARILSFGPIWSCMLENILPYSYSKITLIPFIEGDGKLSIDFDRLDAELSRADIFYLNTPHNPTGKVFSREELTIINELCKKWGVWIISDEAYKDIVFDNNSHVSMLEFDGDHIISVFTGSKSFAATGFRMGYTVSRNKAFIANMIKANYTQTAGLATPQQYALSVALSSIAERLNWFGYLRANLENRRNTIYGGLKALFPNLYKPEGAFYYFLNLNPFLTDVQDKDEYLVDKLMSHGIAVVHGSAFGKEYEGYARLSFSTIESEQLRDATMRLTNSLVKGI